MAAETSHAQTAAAAGHHVEFGYALAQGKRIILVGHRENVFNYLPEIEFVETWPQALDALGPALRGAA